MRCWAESYVGGWLSHGSDKSFRKAIKTTSSRAGFHGFFAWTEFRWTSELIVETNFLDPLVNVCPSSMRSTASDILLLIKVRLFREFLKHFFFICNIFSEIYSKIKSKIILKFKFLILPSFCGYYRYVLYSRIIGATEVLK